MHTVILVPTRNRPELAANAVQSVVDQLPAGVDIVVSDNSVAAADRATLRSRLETLASDKLRVISPPEPLSMTPHWTWALDSILATASVTHVALLTDRMIFKPGCLPALVRAVARHPDDVISYNHDRVDDSRRPVVLDREEWSGRLIRLRSANSIRLASIAGWHPALPRMMNCVVPIATLQLIRERFGSVFASISPDHSFAYRCLVVRDSFLYLDKALLVHYALDRSNGGSYSRGLPSQDNLDFIRALGTTTMNGRTPVPGFHTIGNAILNEYCFVREETGGALPPVDVPSYLDAMEFGIAQLEDAGLKVRMELLLAESDARLVPHRRRSRPVRRIRRRAAILKDHRARAVRLLLERRARSWSDGRDPANWLVGELGRLGLLHSGPLTETFATSEEAVQAACRTSRRPNRHATHLLQVADEADLRRAVPAP